MQLKFVLFLLAWALCAAMVAVGSLSARLLAFLIGSWCIARAYYFIFHVLERYLGWGKGLIRACWRCCGNDRIMGTSGPI